MRSVLRQSRIVRGARRGRRARYAQAYPTLHALSRLSIGHLFDEEIVPIAQMDVNRIDTLDVTPVGFVIGQTILEQLAGSDNR